MAGYTCADLRTSGPDPGADMIGYPIDLSQQKAAKAAGLSYLITFAIVVYVNFGIHERLIVEGNAAETARNILAHETLFRVGIAGDLVYCAGVVVLLTALYVILRPVSHGLAILAALSISRMLPSPARSLHNPQRVGHTAPVVGYSCPARPGGVDHPRS